MLSDLIIYNRLSQLGNVHIFQSGQVITLLLCNNYLLCRPMPMKTQLLKFRMWYLSGCTLAAKVVCVFVCGQSALSPQYEGWSDVTRTFCHSWPLWLRGSGKAARYAVEPPSSGWCCTLVTAATNTRIHSDNTAVSCIVLQYNVF